MKSAPIPVNEQQRLTSLRLLKILDTPAEERFDRITRIAQTLLNVPIVLVSLVDENRQWFKSRQGLSATEVPRELAVCAYTILQDSPFVVPDALLDERFADNPLVVGRPVLRAYAGQTIHLNGQALGTLCAMDHKPRQFTPDEISILRDLAAMVEDELSLYQSVELQKQLAETNNRLAEEIAERERLAESIRLFRLAAESAASGVSIADMSQPDQPLIYVNPAFERITGYGSDTVIGRNCRFLQGPDRNQPEVETLRQSLKNGTPCEVVLRNYRSDGTLFWNELRMAPMVNAAGQVTHFIGIQSDVSARKQAEAEREQLLKDLQIANRLAQENSRLKSEFLSTMSHELRTPLNAIEGFTSIMLGDMGVRLEPQPRKMVERIANNSKRLLQLINDFLDLSRIESGRLEVLSAPFSPADLANKWKSQVGILGEKKDLAFNVTVDPTLPASLMGDEELLSKIAINLLSNAFKFTSTGSVSLTLCNQETTWQIEVADTGIGIPIHARDYIFDEFRQVDSSSKRVYGGTGLGLAIVQKLARAMGGTVTLKSEVGQGSTFTVTLPLQTVSQPEGVQS